MTKRMASPRASSRNPYEDSDDEVSEYFPNLALPTVLPRPSSKPPTAINYEIVERIITRNGEPIYTLSSRSPTGEETLTRVNLDDILDFVSPLHLQEFENHLFRHSELDQNEQLKAYLEEEQAKSNNEPSKRRGRPPKKRRLNFQTQDTTSLEEESEQTEDSNEGLLRGVNALDRTTRDLHPPIVGGRTRSSQSKTPSSTSNPTSSHSSHVPNPSPKRAADQSNRAPSHTSTPSSTASSRRSGRGANTRKMPILTAARAEPEVESVAEEAEEYEVEAILADTEIDEQRYYLVKWAGYPDDAGDWIVERDLEGAADLVEEYWVGKGGKRG